ncbi:hypothetical protein ACIRFH_01325 [Streptomyces sp. NPDC093586]|uniref:hypothetical protein n=1 Tax=Streptomyces sp. NPDC093586 TaxID=3366042 RepID=UPI0038204A86
MPESTRNPVHSTPVTLIGLGPMGQAMVRTLLSAGELVILSLTDYQAMCDVLRTATGALAGRTTVNLSSDTVPRD